MPGDVVGADGVGSRVRRSLVDQGIEVAVLDPAVSRFRCVVPGPDGRWTATQPEWSHDSRRAGVLPLGGEERAVFLS